MLVTPARTSWRRMASQTSPAEKRRREKAKNEVILCKHSINLVSVIRVIKFANKIYTIPHNFSLCCRNICILIMLQYGSVLSNISFLPGSFFLLNALQLRATSNDQKRRKINTKAHYTIFFCYSTKRFDPDLKRSSLKLY